MVLRYFTRPDVTHKLLDLLCANISQCCSSKVFRTVSCRNNETRQTARHFNFQMTWGKTPPLSSEAAMKQCHYYEKNPLHPSLMTALSSQWNFTQDSNIAVMPNSAVLIWAPFVCRRHGSLSTSVGLFNGWGDTLLYKMTARSNKKHFCGRPSSLADPIMAPAFILLGNGFVNTSYKISTQLPKGISAPF